MTQIGLNELNKHAWDFDETSNQSETSPLLKALRFIIRLPRQLWSLYAISFPHILVLQIKEWIQRVDPPISKHHFFSLKSAAMHSSTQHAMFFCLKSLPLLNSWLDFLCAVTMCTFRLCIVSNVWSHSRHLSFLTMEWALCLCSWREYSYLKGLQQMIHL